MTSYRSSIALGAFLLGAGIPVLAAAQSAAPLQGPMAPVARVQEIVVQGNQRIEAETVRSYLSIAEGDPFSDERIDRSLKALYGTGLFADVAVRQEGGALVVRVVENPIINRIAFEGNKRVNDEVLGQETQLRPRVVYTRTKVQNDVKRILDVYRRQGRFAATVEPKIIQLEQNRVDLVFEINEGPATLVRRINVVGNKAYSDSRLREELATKEERWYRLFSTEDTYDPDRLTYDRELLRKFYLSKGYADFRVVSGVAELTPDRESFFITFTIEEGERYKFGKIGLESSLPDLKVEELKPALIAQAGEWYNADEVEADVQMLTDAVGERGYAFVDIKPRVERDAKTRTINLVYEIGEGPRVFVERIDIQGNVRTLDKVIRREFRLVEGDAFNTAKLRRSRQRIRDLNFFQKVEVNNVPSETAPDRTVIKVDVEEKSTGELSFGVGWSTTAGAMIETGVRERNLLGKGQDLRLTGTLGQRRTEIDLGFTEPYFLDRRIIAGVDVFAITRDLEDESSYDSSTEGAALRAGWYFNELLRQDLRYTLKRDKVENVKTSASRYVKEMAGSATSSSVMNILTYDTRDSRIDPTEGYLVRVNNEFVGLGGTERLLRNEVLGAQYWSLGEQLILSANSRFGFVTELGQKVRINDRYFVGSDNLRGFAPAGVSPRDKVTGDALGGMWQYTGSVQLNFPSGLPEELGLGGHVFTDWGTIGATDDSVNSADVNQSQKLRLTVGAGVTWKSPMGPVQVDLGYPVMKENYDETEVFRLNFGTRF